MAKKTLEELQEIHSEMCATAADLGMNVPEDLTVDFDTAELGATVVSSLDALIRKFQAGTDGGDLADEEEQVHTDTPKKTAVKKIVKKTKTTEAAPAEAKKTEEKTVTTAAKKVKKAAVKKTATKAAKAAPAKKAAAKANGAAPKRTSFDESAKITWGGKPNPAREETGRHERIEAVRKASGKTVKTFLASKGNPTTLRNCVAAKLCTVG